MLHCNMNHGRARGRGLSREPKPSSLAGHSQQEKSLKKTGLRCKGFQKYKETQNIVNDIFF